MMIESIYERMYEVRVGLSCHRWYIRMSHVQQDIDMVS